LLNPTLTKCANFFPRLSYNERNFIGINRKLERLQNKENSFERTTTNRLTVLESTVNGDRENFRGMVPR